MSARKTFRSVYSSTSVVKAPSGWYVYKVILHGNAVASTSAFIPNVQGTLDVLKHEDFAEAHEQ